MSQPLEKRVKDAIKQLEREGANVTARAVQDIVHGNYNQVAALLRQYRVEATVAEKAPEEVVSLFTDLADDVYNKARTRAEASFLGERAELKKQLNALVIDRDEAGEIVDNLERELADFKAQAEAREAGLLAEVEAARAARDQAVGRAEVLSADITDLKAQHKKALEAVDVERAAAKQAQEQAAQMSARIERLTEAVLKQPPERASSRPDGDEDTKVTAFTGP